MLRRWSLRVKPATPLSDEELVEIREEMFKFLEGIGFKVELEGGNW